MVYNCLKTLHRWVLPARCRLCLAPGHADQELCADCRQELPWSSPACRRCALPLPADSPVEVCGKCRKAPAPLDGCAALFHYQAPIDQWIQDLKFHQDLGAARLLGQLLAETLPGHDVAQATLVVPVPLHRRRLRERGYNQALELARPLRRLGYPVTTLCCRRHRATAAQSGLPAAQRKRNLSNAFQAEGRLDGRRILLIDDVLTTGSTLNELARTLKRAGAAQVEARVIARAV